MILHWIVIIINKFEVLDYAGLCWPLWPWMIFFNKNWPFLMKIKHNWTVSNNQISKSISEGYQVFQITVNDLMKISKKIKGIWKRILLLNKEIYKQHGDTNWLSFEQVNLETMVCSKTHFKPKQKKLSNLYTNCNLLLDLIAFYLPCKIWGLNFSILQKIFIRTKFYLCMLQIIFPCCKIAYYAALTGIVFSYLYKNLQKMPIVKNFLNKFVNINNHTHNFLHGVLIL